MFSYPSAYTSNVSFVSFFIFRTVSKIIEKGCFGKFCTFTFVIRLKNYYSNFEAVNFLLSLTQTHTHKYTNSTFHSSIIFSTTSFFFQYFLPNQIHRARISSRFLETQSSTYYSIYGLLFLSRAPQDSTDTTVFKLFISSSLYVRTTKISYSKNNICHSATFFDFVRAPY